MTGGQYGAKVSVRTEAKWSGKGTTAGDEDTGREPTTFLLVSRVSVESEVLVLKRADFSRRTSLVRHGIGS
jgi:hypothetical protein